METNTQTPQSTELTPVTHPESAAHIDAPVGAEVVVPPSAEVVRYEAQQALEESGVAAAGYEIAIPTSGEIEGHSHGEVVPLADRLPAIREAVDALVSSPNEELAEEYLEAQGVKAVPERDLKEAAEFESKEPRHDTLLFLRGQEEGEPYAVKVGEETRIMGAIELYQYLVSVREVAPSMSVVDAKGDVLMSAKGEIARAILNQALIMKLALRAVGAAMRYSASVQETYRGSAAMQQEAPLKESTEASNESSVPRGYNSTTTTGASADPSAQSTEMNDATTYAESSSTEMEMYDSEKAEANASNGDTSMDSPEQSTQETDTAAITSGEEGRLAAEAAMKDLFPDGVPTNKEEQRDAARMVKSHLAKEGVHPDRNKENASAAYDVINEKLNF